MTFQKTIAAAVLATVSFAPVAAFAAGDAIVGGVAGDSLITAAEQAGVCGEAGVASATLTDTNTISAVCNVDAVGFLPLIGGLGPAAAAAGLAGAAGVAAVLGNSGGGNSTSDTQ